MSETTTPMTLTIPETAWELRCTRKHVYDLIKEGSLRTTQTASLKGGSKMRVRRTDLEKFASRRSMGGR